MLMFFLYHRTTRPTGEVLARALGMPHGTTPPEERQDVLIRWGATSRVACRPHVTINPASAIERASDKLGSLQLMEDAGVIVPGFSCDPERVVFPCLGRNRSHTRGTDIQLLFQEADVAILANQGHCSDFFVEYVPVRREYRARVVGGECVRVSQKILSNPSEYCPWIRNYEHGHTFVTPQVRLNRFQEALAVGAVEAHGLDFGAVDLVVGDDNITYVLEVNTAPALAPMSAAAMVGGLVRLVQEKAGITIDPDMGALSALSSTDDGDTEDDRDGAF
jgi:hypothetical protein